MKVKCISNTYQKGDNTYYMSYLEIGKIYEISITAKYNGDMYFIPNLSRLIAKELFIEVSIMRNDKIEILLDA